MPKCPICENEEINQEDNYCKICGYKFEKQLIAEILRENDGGITVKIIKDNMQFHEILAGMAILLDIVEKQSKKSTNEILEMLKEIKKNYIESEENSNASK